MLGYIVRLYGGRVRLVLTGAAGSGSWRGVRARAGAAWAGRPPPRRAASLAARVAPLPACGALARRAPARPGVRAQTTSGMPPPPARTRTPRSTMTAQIQCVPPFRVRSRSYLTTHKISLCIRI